MASRHGCGSPRAFARGGAKAKEHHRGGARAGFKVGRGSPRPAPAAHRRPTRPSPPAVVERSVAHQPSRQPSATTSGAGLTSKALERPMRSACAPSGAAHRGRASARQARVSRRRLEIARDQGLAERVRRACKRGLSMRSPAPLRAGGQRISRMEPLPLGIERDRGRDGRTPVRAEMVDADRLADARQSPFDEAERDRAAKARTCVARRHVAQRSPRPALSRRDMRPGRQRRFSLRDAQPTNCLRRRSLATAMNNERLPIYSSCRSRAARQARGHAALSFRRCPCRRR